MNRSAFLTLLFLCLGAGCVRSIQPILSDNQAITDDRLLGSWVSSDGKSFGEVTADGDHKGYKILFTDEDGKKAILLARLGNIGHLTIAQCTVDAQPIHDLGDAYSSHLLPLYSFAIVKQMAPQLVLSSMDSDWLKKYLQANPGELSVKPP